MARPGSSADAGDEHRVLILEDDPADAELIERELRRSRLQFKAQRVQDREHFVAALRTFQPSLILADYTLPRFDALKALELARNVSRHLPFIMITGSIGEEKAAACLRAGVDDYLLKDRLARLGEAVRQAIARSRLREDNARIAKELQASEALHRTFIDSSSDMAFLKDARFRHLIANQALCRFCGRSQSEIRGRTDYELLPRAAAARCRRSDRAVLKQGRMIVQEEAIGDRVFETRKFPVRLAGGASGIGGYIRDISERRRLEKAMERSTGEWNATFDSLKDAIALFDRSGNVRRCNRAFAALVGKPFREVIGRPCSIPPQAAGRGSVSSCPLLRRALRLKRRQTAEIEFSGRGFDLVLDPVLDRLGRLQGIVYSLKDVSERRAAEAERRTLTRALEQNPASVIITDPGGTIEYVNPKFSELTGYSPEEARGSNPRMLKSGEMPAAEYERLWQTIVAGGTWRGEFHNKKKSGELYWESATISPVLDEAGRISHYVAIKEDITQFKGMLESLQESERRFATVFRSSPVPGAITRLSDNRLLDVNAAWRAISGYNEAEAVGRTPAELNLWVDPSARQRMVLALKRGRPVRGLETRIRRKDGGERDVLMSAEKITIHGKECLLTMAIDISERKRGEDALRASEEKYRLLVESANEGICIAQNGFLRFVNGKMCEFSGFAESELTQKPFQEFIHPDDRARVTRFHSERLQGRQVPEAYEFRFLTRAGEYKWATNNGVVIEWQGRPATLNFFSDVTERKLAEAARLESEERFRKLTEKSPFGIAQIELDGRWLYVNPRFTELTGYNLEDIPNGREWFRKAFPEGQLHRQVIADWKHDFIDIIATHSVRRDYPVHRKDGQERILSFVTNMFEANRAIMVVDDVTAVRRAEGALREMNEIFRLFLKHNPIYVFIKDENIRPIYLSDNYQKMLGRPVAELLGRSMADLFPSELSRAMVEDDKAILRDGVPREFVEELDGRTYSTLKFPIIIDGKPKYLAGYTTDITERRRTEAALTDSLELLRIAQRAARAGMWSWDIPTGKLTWSAEFFELFGIDPAIGASFASWLNAVHPEDRDAAMAGINQAIEQRTELLNEYRIVLPGGEIRWIAAPGNTIYDDDGKPLRMSGICIDITWRKQSEGQIQAALNEKEILLKEIHHRVKNNLQVISGLLTLQAGQANDERLLRMLKDSQSRIWTMALIHQTLYQSGNLAAIDMADYIRTLAGNLLSSHARAGMPPALLFDLHSVHLTIDQAIPLALIANELLTNSMKHAFADGRAGEIRVGLRELWKAGPPAASGNGAVPEKTDELGNERRPAGRHTHELTIIDNGIGLPSGFDAARKDTLGLQLVSMLVKQMDGDLSSESREGTTTRITFNANERKKR
jgi:PAS domain S-box-containing protein